jgi:hypothetical protein
MSIASSQPGYPSNIEHALTAHGRKRFRWAGARQVFLKRRPHCATEGASPARATALFTPGPRRKELRARAAMTLSKRTTCEADVNTGRRLRSRTEEQVATGIEPPRLVQLRSAAVGAGQARASTGDFSAIAKQKSACG